MQTKENYQPKVYVEYNDEKAMRTVMPFMAPMRISFIHSLIASSMLCISLYPRFLTEQAGKQRYKGHADKGNAAARHKLFYPQLGVKLCSMAGGGVQKIYMVFLREPSR